MYRAAKHFSVPFLVHLAMYFLIHPAGPFLSTYFSLQLQSHDEALRSMFASVQMQCMHHKGSILKVQEHADPAPAPGVPSPF